jgi:hypothetical protein
MVGRDARDRPAATLSKVESPLKSPRFWNVRATPRAASREVGMRVYACPLMTMRPGFGVYTPVMTLISEVFPAPFGPMIAVIDPSAKARSTSRSAATPPKLRLTPSRASVTDLARPSVAPDGTRGSAREKDRGSLSAAPAKGAAVLAGVVISVFRV